MLHQKSWNVKFVTLIKGKVHINLLWQRIPYFICFVLFFFLECISNLSWCHRKHVKKKTKKNIHKHAHKCRIQKRYLSSMLLKNMWLHNLPKWFKKKEKKEGSFSITDLIFSFNIFFGINILKVFKYIVLIKWGKKFLAWQLTFF